MKNKLLIILILSVFGFFTSCTNPEGEPVLYVDEIADLSYNEGTGVIHYRIENPITGASIDVFSDQDWIHDFDYSKDGEIPFVIDDNNGGTRTANLVISYGPAEEVVVSVRQLTIDDAGNSKIILLTQSPVETDAEGDEVVIEYSIETPVPGKSVQAFSEQKWANHFEYPEEGKIIVFPEANFYPEERKGKIVLSYHNAPDVEVEIIQKPATSDEDPFFITITGITEVEAVVSWFPTDKEMTYLTGFNFKSALDQYEGDYVQYVEDELMELKQLAESQGVAFEEYIGKLLITGDWGTKWFSLNPATEYCAYAYGVTREGEVTSRFITERFKTKSVEQLDCNFSFSENEIHDTEISVKVSPDNPSVRYYPGIISKKDYESAGSDDVIMNQIVDFIDEDIWFNSLFGINLTWSHYTKIGESLVEKDKLFPETEYYVYSFGLEERGLITTTFQKQLFRTKPVDITDDCRFDISSSVTTSYMADFVIKPTNDETVYYVSVLETDFVTQYTLDDVAAMLINSARDEHGDDYDWSNGKYSFSGKQTLNSYSDLDIMPLEPSNNYSLILFGVSPDGHRTTEVAVEQFRTQTLTPSDMTFNLGVTDVEANKITLTCTPSNNDELYILGCIKLDKYKELGSDEAAVNAIVEYWKNSNIYYVTQKGTVSLPTEIDIFYNRMEANTDYYVFAFGYMGAVTTPLTKVRFTTPEGEKPSNASVEIAYTLRSGDELVGENPGVYPPDIWSGMAGAFFTITPNQQAIGWYFATFTNTLAEISTMPKDQLLDNLKKYGSYNQTSTVVKMNWYTTIVAVAIAEDSEGKYGDPVIVEVIASSPYSTNAPELRRHIIINPDKYLENLSSVKVVPVFKGYHEYLKDDFEMRYGNRPGRSEYKKPRQIPLDM